MKKPAFFCAFVVAVIVLITYFPALRIDFIVPDWSFLDDAARMSLPQLLVNYSDPRVHTWFRPLQGLQFFAEYILKGQDFDRLWKYRSRYRLA